MARLFFLGILLTLSNMSAMAEDIKLKPDHPQSYTVVEGDTLWDISAVFLQDPWHWPEIWQANPQIDNPHLIYPGDIVSLVYRDDGRPTLKLSRGATYKLSPKRAKIKEISVEKAISEIPIDVIRAFLTQLRMVSKSELASAPSIVAVSEGRLLSFSGDKVYAEGVEKDSHYQVFRGGQAYVDPKTGETLGYEAMYVGDAMVIALGDPATISLDNVTREVALGDKLLPVVNEDYGVKFIPHSPEHEINGQIIGVSDGLSYIGRYQIVALNVGAQDNLQRGHILSLSQAPITTKNRNKLALPSEHIGKVMVFGVFDKMSYAIVLQATSPIHVNDKVSSTEQIR